MSITFATGDIFCTDPTTGLAHGCNCVGAMGKGIAVLFKNQWPAMYARYKELCNESQFSLGDVFVWRDSVTGRTIFNLGTQASWRSRACPDAIRKAVGQMMETAAELGVSTIAMPLIGSGLGGLEPRLVQTLLTEVAADSAVSLLVCDSYVEGQPLLGE
jgi:O-acetyl-ADP-ribose deacetylase (regulator of RNase III)